MIERLLERKGLLIALIVGGLVVLIGSGIGLWYFWGQISVPSTDLIVPPPSLAELAAQYPQLETLLNDKSLSAVYKDFIIAYEEGGVDAARELAEQRGLLGEGDQIRMSLVIDSPENIPAVSAELEEFGIVVASSSEEEINILIPIPLIERIAQQSGDPNVIFAQLTQLEHILRIKLPIPTQNKESLQQQQVIGEGVSLIRADVWHNAGITGQGVKVGVLDLGFGGYKDLLGSELPANVTTKAFTYYTDDVGNTDVIHGTACAEIVHEVAPDAELVLVMFDGSDDNMLADAVDYLIAQDVDIISYSAGTWYGPKDGSGWHAQLVDTAVANGILWIGAAGNEAVNHFRTTFSDPDNDGFHEFPDGGDLMAFYPVFNYFEVLMQWDDNWNAAQQDYELHVYDSAQNLIASSTEQQAGIQGDEPVEYVSYYDENGLDSVYYIAIEVYEKTRDVTFDIFISPADLSYSTADHSLSSPADARGSFTVGATEWRDDSLAYYSSQGPTDDGRIKPDISGPTTVSGASYGPESFDGTSAATPHVSGAAALVWSAHPEYSREQVMAFLQQYSLDLGASGLDSQFGTGRLYLPDPDSGEVAVNPPPTQESGDSGDGDLIDILPTIDLPTLELPTVELPDVNAPIATFPPPEVSILPTVIPPAEIIPPVPGVTSPSSSLGSGVLAIALLLGGGMCCGGFFFIGGLALVLSQTRKPRRVGRAPAPQARRVPPAPQLQRPWLEAFGQHYPIMPGGITFGRDPDNILALRDSQVSRHHARITFQNGYWLLQDLDSANGTYVNGQRIALHYLREGDQIKIGGSIFKFHAG